MSDTVETPTVTDLHTAALDAMHAAIAAVQAFLGHPDVVDDTAMHTAAKQVDYDLGGALKTLAHYNVTQGVVAADPPEEETPPEEPPPEQPPEPKQPAFEA